MFDSCNYLSLRGERIKQVQHVHSRSKFRYYENYESKSIRLEFNDILNLVAKYYSNNDSVKSRERTKQLFVWLFVKFCKHRSFIFFIVLIFIFKVNDFVIARDNFYLFIFFTFFPLDFLKSLAPEKSFSNFPFQPPGWFFVQLIYFYKHPLCVFLV